jgi:hypothetical protein
MILLCAFLAALAMAYVTSVFWFGMKVSDWIGDENPTVCGFMAYVATIFIGLALPVQLFYWIFT